MPVAREHLEVITFAIWSNCALRPTRVSAA